MYRCADAGVHGCRGARVRGCKGAGGQGAGVQGCMGAGVQGVHRCRVVRWQGVVDEKDARFQPPKLRSV